MPFMREFTFFKMTSQTAFRTRIGVSLLFKGSDSSCVSLKIHWPLYVVDLFVAGV